MGNVLLAKVKVVRAEASQTVPTSISPIIGPMIFFLAKEQFERKPLKGFQHRPNNRANVFFLLSKSKGGAEAAQRFPTSQCLDSDRNSGDHG